MDAGAGGRDGWDRVRRKWVEVDAGACRWMWRRRGASRLKGEVEWRDGLRKKKLEQANLGENTINGRWAYLQNPDLR